MTDITRDTIVDVIADIFERCGGQEYLGEPVTMAEHMLQGATFAERDGQPDHIIVAALLHDIGHFTGEFGTFSMEDTHDRFHEHAGEKLLRDFFPAVITDCVNYHVAAKRYLCATDPEYFAKLSPASVHSLNLQGGPMTTGEVAEFKQNPHLEAIIQVRLYDDMGKVAGMKTPSYAHFAPRVAQVVNAN